MEIAAAKLEALVKHASTRLDGLTYELDLKLKKKGRMQTSVINIVQKLQDMSQEFERMKQESKILENEQKAAIEGLVSLLPEMSKKLDYLDVQTGSNNNNYARSDLINQLDNMNV